MRMKLFTGVMAVLGTAVSTAAWADAPRYDFAEAFYQSFNDPSASGLGSDHAFGVDGSYALTDRWIGMASYAHEQADYSPPSPFSGLQTNASLSGDSYEFGFGYRFPLTGSVDLVPNLAYDSQSASASAPGFSNSVSNSGYDAGILLRAMATPRVELDAAFDHTTPGSASNQVALAALYGFTPDLSVGLAYASARSGGQSTTGWSLTLRYYFK